MGVDCRMGLVSWVYCELGDDRIRGIVGSELKALRSGGNGARVLGILRFGFDCSLGFQGSQGYHFGNGESRVFR